MAKAKKDRTISEVVEVKETKKGRAFKDAWGVTDPLFDRKLVLFLKSTEGKPTQGDKVAFLRRYIGTSQLDCILNKAAEELK